MVQFIYKCIKFFSAIVIVSSLLDIFVSNQLEKSRIDELSVWNDIYSGSINADLVIHGSSRAWVHFDSKIISDSLNLKVYNLGIDGHNFWLQCFRHSELLKYNKTPEFVIVSVDAYTFYKRPDLYESTQFLPYMLNNKAIEEATNSYLGFSFLDYHLPLVRYYGRSDAVIQAFNVFNNLEISNSVRVKGYKGQNRVWETGGENLEIIMHGYRLEPDRKTIDLFDKFLDDCSENNVKVILVYTPEFYYYQHYLLNREEIFDMFKYFSEKYSIPFYDYSNDSISYDKKRFYNSLHLNKDGAELFTKKLLFNLRNEINN